MQITVTFKRRQVFYSRESPRATMLVWFKSIDIVHCHQISVVRNCTQDVHQWETDKKAAFLTAWTASFTTSLEKVLWYLASISTQTNMPHGCQMSLMHSTNSIQWRVLNFASQHIIQYTGWANKNCATALFCLYYNNLNSDWKTAYVYKKCLECTEPVKEKYW